MSRARTFMSRKDVTGHPMSQTHPTPNTGNVKVIKTDLLKLGKR